MQPDTRANVVLRGGRRDGEELHLGRGGEPEKYVSACGDIYEATIAWEGSLRVYRLAIEGTKTRGGW